MACAGSALILCGIGQRASAQEIDRYFSQGVAGYGVTPGVTVLSRLRPEYEPAGIRLGSFIVNANLSEALGYDSNPIGQPQAEPSLLVQSEGSLLARSDWGRHRVNFAAGVIDRRYPAQPQQSTTDWSAVLGGTYDIGRDQVGLRFAHVKGSQTPRDLNNPLLTGPASYNVNSVQANYSAIFGRFALVPSVELGIWRYQDVMQDGAPVILTYQNRNVITANLVGRYQASEHRSLLVIFRGIQNAYTAPLFGQPSRNSDGMDMLVGVEYGTGGVWRYRVLAGYQTRQYASPAYPPLNGPMLEVNVIWQPTGLTSVTGSVLNTIAESPLTDNPNYTLSQARITVDHELQRNILMQARLEIDRATYPQNAGSATFFTTGPSLTWLVNRRVRVVGSYDYSSRQSGVSSYAESVALVRVRFGL